jgi:hypothetical protein
MRYPSDTTHQHQHRRVSKTVSTSIQDNDSELIVDFEDTPELSLSNDAKAGLGSQFDILWSKRCLSDGHLVEEPLVLVDDGRVCLQTLRITWLSWFGSGTAAAFFCPPIVPSQSQPNLPVRRGL